MMPRVRRTLYPTEQPTGDGRYVLKPYTHFHRGIGYLTDSIIVKYILVDYRFVCSGVPSVTECSTLRITRAYRSPYDSTPLPHRPRRLGRHATCEAVLYEEMVQHTVETLAMQENSLRLLYCSIDTTKSGQEAESHRYIRSMLLGREYIRVQRSTGRMAQHYFILRTI